MASSCEKLDHLVKDYLLFRGFSATLKALDQELKTDRDKGLRVDRMMEQIWTYLSTYDLTGLREYWRYLNQRLFSRLEQRYSASVNKLESNLLKLYVVNAHQSGRQDKVLTFFEVLGSDLQTHPDFKDWFAFPFVNSPVENPMFSLYFNKQWQDTLQLSLHNFLSVILQAMPVPTLLNVEFDARRMKTLQEENTVLKQQILNASAHSESMTRETRAGTRRSLHAELHPPASPPDMVYDFSGLTNEMESVKEKQRVSSRRFPLSFPSPLGHRKKVGASQVAKGKSSGQASASSAPTALPGKQTKKVTELSVFPPPFNLRHTENKKSATSSVQTTTTSAPSVTSSTQRSLSTSTRQSAPLAETIVGDGSGSGTRPTSVSRTVSVPEAKRASSNTRSKSVASKPIASRPTSAVSASNLSDVQSDNTGTPEKVLEKIDQSSPVGADCDSPFLLLEDEYMEHSSMACYCRFSTTGQYVASLDVDGIVKVWMWSPQPATEATIMSKSAFLSLTWVSRSDRWLLLGNKTGSIRLFDVSGSKTFREVLVHPDSPANCLRVTDLTTNPSSTQFVCATSDLCPFLHDPSTVSGRLLLWDLRTLKLERALMVDSNSNSVVTCSCFDPSGQSLITGGADGFIKLYDIGQKRPAMKWQAHDEPIHSVQLDSEGRVYSMASDGKFCEWNIARPGLLVNSLAMGKSNVSKVPPGSFRSRMFAFDIGEQYLLTYSGRRGVIYKVSGVPTPERMMELKSHPSPVVTVDWSPSQDTKVCLTGSMDGNIKISTLLSK